MFLPVFPKRSTSLFQLSLLFLSAFSTGAASLNSFSNFITGTFNFFTNNPSMFRHWFLMVTFHFLHLEQRRSPKSHYLRYWCNNLRFKTDTVLFPPRPAIRLCLNTRPGCAVSNRSWCTLAVRLSWSWSASKSYRHHTSKSQPLMFSHLIHNHQNIRGANHVPLVFVYLSNPEWNELHSSQQRFNIPILVRCSCCLFLTKSQNR